MPQKYRRIIVQIIDTPFTYFRKVFFLKVLNEIISLYLYESCKNTRVNFTTDGISLTLIQHTTPVREVFVDEFYQDLVIIFNTFCIQDFLETFEEL